MRLQAVIDMQRAQHAAAADAACAAATIRCMQHGGIQRHRTRRLRSAHAPVRGAPARSRLARDRARWQPIRTRARTDQPLPSENSPKDARRCCALLRAACPTGSFSSVSRWRSSAALQRLGHGLGIAVRAAQRLPQHFVHQLQRREAIGGEAHGIGRGLFLVLRSSTGSRRSPRARSPSRSRTAASAADRRRRSRARRPSLPRRSPR